MNSYFSLAFFSFFFPFAVLAYSLTPRRARWSVLLIASYVFFWFLSGTLIVFLAISTISVYLCGRGLNAAISKRDSLLRLPDADGKQIKTAFKRRMRWIVAGGVLFNLGILIALKYLGFFFESSKAILAVFGYDINPIAPSIGVPIGISFYTMMAISYMIDVYRGTISAETHIGKLALFLCFFPQIMEGPICRYEQTSSSLFAGSPIRRENLSGGILRILFGLAKKLIVADRLNIFIKTVFNDYTSYDGGIIALAAVLYTLQLYCDFSGTMDVAIGMARIFNVKLPENFRQPFFSKTASEFWKRWHITLGEWFKSYVYYPVSLSKIGKQITRASRKKLGPRYGPLMASTLALFCVWIGNGLWHGAGSQYIFFGMYYFVLILAGGLIEPVAADISSKIKLDRNALPYRIFQNLRTLVIIFIGEMFFRATSAAAGLQMFNTLVTNFTLDSIVSGKILTMGLDIYDMIVIAIAVVVLFGVGIAKERGADIIAKFSSARSPVQIGAFVGIFMIVVVFGAYGTGYVPVDPMYAQF